ncbi:DUF58 domain-containing protein [Candidatus Entotheonella palauensis]|uniref:DUF58 domain-containing protein n=1 Tax=Candidatus Entotheonella palauensis TaxID=93172 RepID=UPI000B7DED6B|nr:DUF58 domain-containing protein [Candidatus Entotheonella palauensis]
MWFNQPARPAKPSAPDRLTLHELIATQPRFLRGSLAPGDRFPTGMRPGRRRAQGVDLDSIGPYVPGDDVRWMDWRATARTGRAQMKRFVAESHLARMFIVDLRPPLFFGTRYGPMAKTAALAAARFAWEALSLHEPVGLIVVPMDEVIQPRRGKGQVIHLLQHLETCYQELVDRRESPPGATLARAVETAAGHLRRGDEICAISDFSEPQGPLAEAAAGLGDARKLSAVMIEDAVFSDPVPAGHYPMRRADGDGRYTAAVSNQGAHEQAQIAEDMRKSLRTTLARSGWQTFIIDAHSLHLGRESST